MRRESTAGNSVISGTTFLQRLDVELLKGHHCHTELLGSGPNDLVLV